jgi:hypothetical protein
MLTLQCSVCPCSYFEQLALFGRLVELKFCCSTHTKIPCMFILCEILPPYEDLARSSQAMLLDSMACSLKKIKKKSTNGINIGACVLRFCFKFVQKYLGVPRDQPDGLVKAVCTKVRTDTCICSQLQELALKRWTVPSGWNAELFRNPVFLPCTVSALQLQPLFWCFKIHAEKFHKVSSCSKKTAWISVCETRWIHAR